MSHPTDQEGCRMTGVDRRVRANGGPRKAARIESVVRAAAEPAVAHDPDEGRLRIRKFDADRRDREITLRQAIELKLSDRQLLWVDLEGDVDPGEIEALGKRFEFDEQTRRLFEDPEDRPHLAVHGSYFHLSVAAEPVGGASKSPIWLHIAASRNVVVTRHRDRIGHVEDVDRRIKADATLGEVEGAEFVATLLEAVVTSYFNAVDEIEGAIDELDARSLQSDRQDILDDLVAVRRRVASLRRVVTAHRGVFSSLAGPVVRKLVGGPDAAADLQAVAVRFEAAVAAIEATREALLGSFEVYMTRTAQRTNDVMKVLTIATVILLPATVVASLMGMNVDVPLNKDNPLSFWAVVGGMVVLSIVILGFARLRRWI